MIVLNLELDNLFSFEDFKINFLYTKHIRDIEKTMRFSIDSILEKMSYIE